MVTAVLFDMDGTLLPMDFNEFLRSYMGLLCRKAIPLGYEAKSLTDAVWKGIAAMVQNDGSETNESAFWRVFSGIYGDKGRNGRKMFEEFYDNEFLSLREVCGYNPAAASLVRDLRAAGIRTVLATNPIFPASAIETRIGWAGLRPDEFELVTTYESSRHCKPNPAYYRDIIESLSLRPEECVMVGNDAEEDLAACREGIDTFLLTDCLLHEEKADITVVPHGDYTALRDWLKGKDVHI